MTISNPYSRPRVENSGDPLLSDGLPLADIDGPPVELSQPAKETRQADKDGTPGPARPLTLHFLVTPVEDPDFWRYTVTDDVTFTNESVEYGYNNYLTEYATILHDDD